jgi:hypothetical protein
VADSGKYKGFEDVVTLFKILGEKYTFSGGLGLHMLMAPIVEVSNDGKTVKGMRHSFGYNTIQTEDGLTAMLQAGKYDLEFIKEDGK